MLSSPEDVGSVWMTSYAVTVLTSALLEVSSSSLLPHDLAIVQLALHWLLSRQQGQYIREAGSPPFPGGKSLCWGANVLISTLVGSAAPYSVVNIK
jgi:hypothetical protein